MRMQAASTSNRRVGPADTAPVCRLLRAPERHASDHRSNCAIRHQASCQPLCQATCGASHWRARGGPNYPRRDCPESTYGRVADDAARSASTRNVLTYGQAARAAPDPPRRRAMTRLPLQMQVGKSGSREFEHPCGFAADWKSGTLSGSRENRPLGRSLASAARTYPQAGARLSLVGSA